jgi:hypothetical protein
MVEVATIATQAFAMDVFFLSVCDHGVPSTMTSTFVNSAAHTGDRRAVGSMGIWCFHMELWRLRALALGIVLDRHGTDHLGRGIVGGFPLNELDVPSGLSEL